MRAIKKDEISVKMVYTVTFIGLFLIYAVYGLFTVYDVRRTEKAADKTLLFAKARILRYEDYKENDKVKSLYRLLDKTTEAARSLDKEAYDESFFEDYVYEQRLGGICIFDSDMNCEYFTEDSDIWWKKISDSANIDNNVITQIIEYPLKSYMTRIELDDGEYDMAAVSRRDKCVVPEARERNRRGDIVCAECIERERAASDSNGRHDGGDEEAPNESQANGEKAESYSMPNKPYFICGP